VPHSANVVKLIPCNQRFPEVYNLIFTIGSFYFLNGLLVKGHVKICLIEDFLVRIITTEEIKLHFICSTLHEMVHNNIGDLS